VAFTGGVLPGVGLAADHNDPNAINSIFADISLSGADLYDLFGFPADGKTGGEKVVVALTFAPVPKTGVFDTTCFTGSIWTRIPGSLPGSKTSLTGRPLLIASSPFKINISGRRRPRYGFNKKNQAKVNFIDFPGGGFSKVIDTNKVETIESPDKQSIKAYIGGRDDAFFNDLPGFFRLDQLCAAILSRASPAQG
jgi:hypothetical protein